MAQFSEKILTLLIAASVLSAQTSARRSKSGAETLRGEVARFDQMIEQNRNDFSNAIGKRMVAVGIHLAGEQGEKVGNAKTAYETAQAAISGDRLTLISEAAKNVSKLIETVAPASPVGAGLKLLRPPTEKVLVPLVEMGFLTIEHMHLLEQRERLFVQSIKETARDPAELAYWEKIFRNLHETQTETRKTLAARVSPAALEQILRSQTDVGDTERLAKGVMILDPNQQFWDLDRMPGTSPKLIASLRRQLDLLSRGEVEAASQVNLEASPLFGDPAVDACIKEQDELIAGFCNSECRVCPGCFTQGSAKRCAECKAGFQIFYKRCR